MGAQIQDGVGLLQKRKQIDLLDAELLRLLNERARIVLELAAIKKSSGLPAYDGQREQEVLDRICRKTTGPWGRRVLSRCFAPLSTSFAG